MEVITVGKNTQIHSFPDLKRIAQYGHPNDLNTDLNIYKDEIFILTHKNVGVEFIEVKEGTENIKRMRKMKFDNLFCTASEKKFRRRIALGVSNDAIRILNLKTNMFDKKLNIEANNNPIFLDFENHDEYLASVFESGVIKVYGMKTGVVTDNIDLDKHSALARFHPTNRFHLNVGSFMGAVTVFDVHSKNYIFRSGDAHKAQVKDVCTPAEAPNRLFSVSYDQVVNIFDTRKNARNTVSLRTSSPVSCISSTNCGGTFVIGTIKGEVIGYDFRNLKAHISMAKPHDHSIQRLCLFSSASASKSADRLPGLREKVEDSIVVDEPVENNPNISNISFMDEIMDLQRRGRKSDFYSRVSVDNSAVLGDRGSIGGRNSNDFGCKNTAAMLHELSLNNLNDSDDDDFDPNISNVNVDRLKKRQKSDVRKSSANLKILENISEETNYIDCLDSVTSKDSKTDCDSLPSTPLTSEALANFGTPVQASSTPEIKTVIKKSSESETETEVDGSRKISVTPNRNSLLSDYRTPITDQVLALPPNLLTREEFQRGIDEVKQRIDEKTKEVYQLVLFDKDRMHVALESYIAAHTYKINEKLNALQESVALMMQEDTLIQNCLQLHNENALLKARLNEMSTRLSNNNLNNNQ